jgi:hypothetical protein
MVAAVIRNPAAFRAPVVIPAKAGIQRPYAWFPANDMRG